MKHAKLLTVMLALVLLCGIFPVAASARQDREFLGTAVIDRRINPLYEGLIDESELISGSFTPPALDAPQLYATNYVSMDEAAQQVRNAMAARKATFEIHVKDESSDYDDVLNRLMEEAFAHTGVSTEGDYLRWQYQSIGGSVTQGSEGESYLYSFTIEMTYYTTAAQEKELTTAVNNLLKTLNVSSKSDYQKVCAVYDYICDNITYDYANLEDDSYTLKFTAYAALQNKTAVCQGYALLFYRLMLEVDVDARLIGGDGGGPHGWNIVRLGNVYYNLDATWDAGAAEYQYFLKNTANFVNHSRYLEYMTTQFHTDYPMSATDYVDGVEGEPEYYFVFGQCGDDVYWAIDRDRNMTVMGNGPTYDAPDPNSNPDEVVPWTYWADGFDALVIEDGVTVIGDNLFSGFDNLRSVTTPKSLIEIGDHAFSGTFYLEELNLSEGLQILGEFAFGNQLNLKSLRLPDSLTTIGNSAFYASGGIVELTIGSGLVNVGSYVFSNSDNLTTVLIREGATTIGDGMFSACDNLSQVTLPSTLKTIGESAFHSTALTSIVIPDSVTEIGESVFSYADCLESAHIGSGITQIPEKTFYMCGRLDSVTMSDNVKVIGKYAFNGSLNNLKLSNCLERICESAFRGSGLSKIELPDSLKVIEIYAFTSCQNLTEVTIPASVTNLSGFYNCPNLEKVTIKEGNLESIDFLAFSTCPKLESFTVPASVKTIAESTFSDCDALAEVVFLGDAPNINTNAFENTTTTAYYPGDLEGWTEDVLQDYGGDITWVSTHTHKYTASGVTAPTCTEAGYTTYICSSCGHITNNDYVDALGHDYGKPVYQGREAGHRYACDRCGDVKTEDCSFDGGAIVKEATLNASGVRKHTCTLCGGSYETAYQYRISGEGRVETALEVAEQLKSVLKIRSFQSVIIANGDNFADALAGSYLAARKEAPILLHRSSGKGDDLNEDYILENLAQNGTVYLLGGTAAVPASIEESLSALGYRVIRLAGDTRFDTNLKILEEAGVEAGNEILITTAWDFADCLAASATGKPILMLNTVTDRLTESQKEFLANYAENDFIIIGGPAAVSEKLQDDIEAIAGDTGRVFGKSREETAASIGELFFKNSDCVLLAYSRNFPDGLCGGPLAHAMNGPLLLVSGKREAPAADYVSSNGILRGIVLGGTVAVSEESVEVIFGE